MLVGLPLSAGAAEKPHSGYILKQTSQVCGDVTVYLTANALKVVDPKTSTTLVSKGPDWKVQVFNTSNKTEYMVSFDKFQGYSRMGLQVQMGFKYGGIKLVKRSGSSTILGVTTNTYGTSDVVENSSRRLFLAGKVSGGAPWTARLSTASGWTVPAQPGEILSRLYGVDDTPDIPLEFHCQDQERSDKVGLKTHSIKKVVIAANEFDCPSGYRPVTTMEGVRLDAGGQGAMEDMLKGLDDRIDGKYSTKSQWKPK